MSAIWTDEIEPNCEYEKFAGGFRSCGAQRKVWWLFDCFGRYTQQRQEPSADCTKLAAEKGLDIRQ